MYFWEERGKMSMNRILVAFCCASLNCLWQNVSRQKKCHLAHLHMGAEEVLRVKIKLSKGFHLFVQCCFMPC